MPTDCRPRDVAEADRRQIRAPITSLPVLIYGSCVSPNDVISLIARLPFTSIGMIDGAVVAPISCPAAPAFCPPSAYFSPISQMAPKPARIYVESSPHLSPVICPPLSIYLPCFVHLFSHLPSARSHSASQSSAIVSPFHSSPIYFLFLSHSLSRSIAVFWYVSRLLPHTTPPSPTTLCPRPHPSPFFAHFQSPAFLPSPARFSPIHFYVISASFVKS